jgi:hypothetical protein
MYPNKKIVSIKNKLINEAPIHLSLKFKFLNLNDAMILPNKKAMIGKLINIARNDSDKFDIPTTTKFRTEFTIAIAKSIINNCLRFSCLNNFILQIF